MRKDDVTDCQILGCVGASLDIFRDEVVQSTLLSGQLLIEFHGHFQHPLYRRAVVLPTRFEEPAVARLQLSPTMPPAQNVVGHFGMWIMNSFFDRVQLIVESLTQLKEVSGLRAFLE